MLKKIVGKLEFCTALYHSLSVPVNKSNIIKGREWLNFI